MVLLKYNLNEILELIFIRHTWTNGLFLQIINVNRLILIIDIFKSP